MGKIFKALEKSEKSVSIPENINETEHESMNMHQNEIHDDDENLLPELDLEKLITVSTPHSVVSEQFRLLKNNILFPENGHPPKTIMVTSPSPGEGKSFISANLAVIIAQSIDEYVLLIDCDLRKPTIHKLFGYDGKTIKGLSDYLSNNMALSGALKKTKVNKGECPVGISVRYV